MDKEVEDEDEVEDGDSKGRLDPPPHTPPTSADDDEPPSPSHGDGARHDPVPEQMTLPSQSLRNATM